MKYFTATLLSLIIIFLSLPQQSLVAQENIPEGTGKIIIDGKEYYLHKVRKGEGLYRISVSYGVSQKEILEVNPAVALGLKEGQLVRVPVIKGRNNTAAQLNAEQYIYHTVEKGQTAYYIAKRYRVELEDIYANNPGSRQQLLEGVIIKIPKNEIVPDEEVLPEEGYHLHKVAPKETLYGIARQYGVDIPTIIRHNEGLESGVLSVGSLVRIPMEKAVAEQEETSVELDGSEDANFIYHTIKQGETLYSIAEAYNAKMQEVAAANASVDANDLPLGYLVRIPKASIKQAKNEDAYADAAIVEHKIKRRESLTDVEERYGVPVELIEKVNKAEGIDLADWRKGMVIKVPTKQWVEDYYAQRQSTVEVQDAVDMSEFVTFEKKECERYDYGLNSPALKVALLLPFNVEATQQGNLEMKEVDGDTIEVVREKRRLSVRSKVFVEFYQGTLLALETLKKEGVNIDMFVYDTAPDTNRVKEILMQPELMHADLIIGPAYSTNLKYVSDFSRRFSIPMVYPLSTTNSELYNNPLLFQANAADTLMLERMAQKMIEESNGSRMVMIRTESEENEFEQRLSKLLRDKVYWESFKNGEIPDFVEYKFKQDDLVSLERMFDKNKKNTVLIPSVEEAQVNRIITTVKGAADKTKADVTLWGLPDWLKYNTVNPEDIHRLNGQMFSYYAVDYKDTLSEGRIEAYRQWFGTEPMAISPFFETAGVHSNMSRYSLWGYDLSYYFLSALRDYGREFTHCLQYHHPHTLQSALQFERISNWGGFYNKGLFLINFRPNYEVEIETVQ
ncbi:MULTISPECIES: LysM peptidoglycan-binding domain-containing protein [unclassified Carboxylicivirga]|uniref:LysM peptidoglycan-binding domain-containing protein n=1 Tax=Carboxylicivirga TaxID=1628153 RepID=UPI003D33463F